MNHPIFKATTNVGFLGTQIIGRRSIKVEQNSHKPEYRIVIRECSKERKSFTKGSEALWSNTIITTLTPDISRISGAKLHLAAQGLPPLEND
jgi:hypothetical protein